MNKDYCILYAFIEWAKKLITNQTFKDIQGNKGINYNQ